MTILIVYWTIVALVDYYNKKQKELEDQLNNELHTQILLNRQYHLYNHYELIREKLELFVKKHSSIHAVQLNNYEIKHIGSNTRIKVKYLAGYIDESIELNALDQSYFHCDKSMYSEFVKAKKSFDSGHYAPMLRFLIQHRSDLITIQDPTF